MSKVSAFGFTNTTASTHTVTPTNLGMATNYALNKEVAEEATMSNKTAPIDAEELVTYRSRPISKINTNLVPQFPAPVKSGIQYQVQIEAILSTTDTADPSFRVDEPVVMQLSIRHPKSGNVTGTIVATMFDRLIGTLQKSDGTWRFDDLMRGAERPVVD